jgi:hypothetical protein
LFDGSGRGQTIVEEKPVSVGTEYEWNVESLSVSKPLLHAGPHAVVVVLSLNDCELEIGAVGKDQVCKLPLTSLDGFAFYQDWSIGEVDLLSNLELNVPAGSFQGWYNELGADIAFGELAFL